MFEFKLIGTDALWEIMLQVRDANVHKKAFDFLHKLYKRVNSEVLQERLLEMKLDLLKICMD